MSIILLWVNYKEKMPFIYNDQISFKNPIVGNPTLIPLNPTGDPYINNVVLFINGSIADSSPSAKTLTNGGAVLSNAQVKYNLNSILVSGGQFLLAPVNNDFNLGTGDFTVEFWLRLNAAPLTASGNGLIDSRFNSTNQTGDYLFLIRQDLIVGIVSYGSTNTVFYVNNPISLNTWTHIAYSRVSGIVKIFLNGILEITASFPFSMSQSGDLVVMGHAYRNTVSNLLPDGYFDSIRITKGVGRYTANFNPETATYLQNI
jgi:hypothetical protein